MPQYRLACPHCSRTFSLEHLPPARQVECPACHQMLALPEHLPAPVKPGASSSVAPRVEDGLSSPPIEPPAAAPDIALPATETASDVGVRHLSREEKVRRRQVRSLALMIAGMILLAAAVIVLSRM